MSGKLMVVAGGQYGSEGKGAVAAYLSAQEKTHLAVRVAGPNAGHTVIGNGPDGEPGFAWRLRALPVAAVSNRQAALAIAAGSEVDMPVLEAERAALDAAGYDVTSRLFIDAQATLLTPDHIDAEIGVGLQERLGSTAKGIGAARADRIWRTADLVGGKTDVANDLIKGYLAMGGSVLIEGTQGYGLGLHAGDYPFSTSSDCRAVDFCAMAGISPWDERVDALEIWLAFRTRPIRVAGNSGPMRQERTWGDLGLPEEHTTVTQKVRRVGEWDSQLAQRAIEANGGPSRVFVALTMVDQVVPGCAGWTMSSALESVQAGETDPVAVLSETVRSYEADLRTVAMLLGTGPDTMMDRRHGYGVTN